jgi:hypothetical protein
MPSTTRPLLGRIAVVAACLATVVGPLHALSRYATADGKEDLASPLVQWWAEPAARALRPLLQWSDPDTVYLTYGKGWFPILLVTTVVAFTVRRQRTPVGLERWGWPIALTGYVLATASVLGDYWTPWLDQSFVLLGIPGMLVTLVGNTVLGIALVRRGFRPRATAWLLATWLLSLAVLNSVLAQGAALIPIIWAWALAGREYPQAPASEPSTAVAAPAER